MCYLFDYPSLDGAQRPPQLYEQNTKTFKQTHKILARILLLVLGTRSLFEKSRIECSLMKFKGRIHWYLHLHRAEKIPVVILNMVLVELFGQSFPHSCVDERAQEAQTFPC